jgi:hypothetical protein
MQLPGNTFEIVKTQHFKGIATLIKQANTLKLPDGRDIQLKEGDHFIQYDQGFYEIIRGNINFHSGVYSKYVEAKIVDNKTLSTSENIIVPIPLYSLMNIIEEEQEEKNKKENDL